MVYANTASSDLIFREPYQEISSFGLLVHNRLGTVGELRKAMSIGKEHRNSAVVYKFGRTNDIGVRMKAHSKTYGALAGADPTLIYHGQVDVQHASKAETSISHLMQGMQTSFAFENSKEIVIATDKQLKLIKEHFDTVTELYRGRVKEMKDALREKDHEIAMLRKDMVIKDKDAELLAKDNTILRLQLAAVTSK